MISTQLRTTILSAALIAAACCAASAQNYGPACQRLEAQLASLDRGSNDAARADQIRRLEEATTKQQSDIDRLSAQSRRMGCESSGFFQLFNPNQNPQCGPLNNQIQQLRANLNRSLSELQSAQRTGANYERDGQRRALIAALAQNDCGPQYRQAAAAGQPRNFFDTLFGNNQGQQGEASGSSFRTVCVRTCDGGYFPISFSTNPSRFGEDEKTCQRMCPATEVMLFSYPNPGGDITQATSTSGQTYSQLPNAFKFRQQFDNACSCRRPGESWADTMKGADERVAAQPGDIVVTDERAKQMSQPRDAKGRPIKPVTTGTVLPADPVQPQAAAPSGPPANPEPAAVPTGPIRTVGPQLGPVR
jgi:hypothetical protein